MVLRQSDVPADVMFVKSTDGGVSYSSPIRINTDAGTTAYQWMGTMAVAPNGRIDVVWLDTRDAPGGTYDSRLYYTFSEDQGDSWMPEEAISPAFNPNIGYPNQDKMGDYFDMVSTNEGAHLAWANTLNGGQDVYYTFIDPQILGVNEFSERVLNASVYPNPFLDETRISFSVKKETKVTVSVFNLLGKKITTLLNDTVSGTQELVWNSKTNQGITVQSGLYFVQISSGKTVTTLKLIKR